MSAESLKKAAQLDKLITSNHKERVTRILFNATMNADRQVEWEKKVSQIFDETTIASAISKQRTSPKQKKLKTLEESLANQATLKQDILFRKNTIREKEKELYNYLSGNHQENQKTVNGESDLEIINLQVQEIIHHLMVLQRDLKEYIIIYLDDYHSKIEKNPSYKFDPKNLEQLEKYEEELLNLKIDNKNPKLNLNFNIQKVFTHLQKYKNILDYTKNRRDFDCKEENKDTAADKESKVKHAKREVQFAEITDIKDITKEMWYAASYKENTTFFVENADKFIKRIVEDRLAETGGKKIFKYHETNNKIQFYKDGKLVQNPDHQFEMDFSTKKEFSDLSLDEIFVLVQEREEYLGLSKNSEDKTLEDPFVKRLLEFAKINNLTKREPSEDDKSEVEDNEGNTDLIIQKKDSSNIEPTVPLSSFAVDGNLFTNIDEFIQVPDEGEYADDMPRYLKSLLTEKDTDKQTKFQEIISEKFKDYKKQDIKKYEKAFKKYIQQIEKLHTELKLKRERKDSEVEFNGLVKALGMLSGAAFRTREKGLATDMSGEQEDLKSDGTPVTAEHLATSKGYKRAMEKIIQDYDGNINKFNDAKRATLEYQTPQEILAAVEQLLLLANQHKNIKKIEFVDKFGRLFEPASLASGYRDFKCIIHFYSTDDSAGETAELMFHVSDFLKTKIEGYPLPQEVYNTIGFNSESPDYNSEMQILQETIERRIPQKLAKKIKDPEKWGPENGPSEDNLYHIRRALQISDFVQDFGINSAEREKIIDASGDTVSLPEDYFIDHPVTQTKKFKKALKKFKIKNLESESKELAKRFNQQLKGKSKIELSQEVKRLAVGEKLEILGTEMYHAAHKNMLKKMVNQYNREAGNSKVDKTTNYTEARLTKNLNKDTGK